MNRPHFFLALLALSLSPPVSASSKARQMKPEEFLEKHLASIGAPAPREQRNSLRATGAGNLKALVGSERQLQGQAELLSLGPMFRFSLLFDVSDYPGEVLAFDGKKTYVEQLNPGQRSMIGGFLYRYEEILTEGLFGGTLSTGWALLRADDLQPRLRHRGLRKFGQSELHEVEYRRRKGRKDIDVKLYFLPDTFHHVASVYRLEIPPSLPDISTGPADARAANSSSQVGSRITLEEYFSEFRAVANLALPTRWRVRLTAEGPESELSSLGFTGASRDLAVLEWNVDFSDIEVNVPDLAAEDFVLY